MPFTSLEVRWFLPVPPGGDEEIVDWFRRGAPAGASGLAFPVEWREDTYARLPGVHDFGIKLREDPAGPDPDGRLEYKGRTEALGVVEFGPGIRGVVERWAKWSYLADGLPAAAGVRGSAGRPIRKRRIIRRIQLLPGGRFEEMADPATRVDRGLGFEITRVHAGDRSWMTVGFEAFPGDVSLEEEFVPAVTHLLQGMPEPGSLDADRSMSYPQWLDELDS